MTFFSIFFFFNSFGYTNWFEPVRQNQFGYNFSFVLVLFDPFRFDLVLFDQPLVGSKVNGGKPGTGFQRNIG